MKTRIAAWIGIVVIAVSPSFSQIGLNARLAWSADGNIHDPDDWGATPWSLAIFRAFGVSDRIVHYDYSNHIGESTARGEGEMTESVTGGVKHFGPEASRFFDCTRNLDGAIANFKAEGNKSSASDPLVYICAGPMEIPYRALAAVDLDKRKYITLVSHSGWNNNHVHGGILSKTWTSMKSLPGGAKFIDISDQNAALGTSSAGDWNELKGMGPKYEWLFTRQLGKPGDVSDAGMAWFAMTGQQNGKPAQIIAKFKSTPTAIVPVLSAGGGSLSQVRSGNALLVQLPFSGTFTGITISDLSGQRRTFANASRRDGWIEVPGQGLSKGPYIVSVNGPDGVQRTAGKVTFRD